MPRNGLIRLFSVLIDRGYRLIGPTISNGAIVFDEISKLEDLPVGWTDKQSPGGYRLEKRGDNRVFGFVVGPHSWKKYLFPAKQVLQDTTVDKLKFDSANTANAFIGVRACDLAAIGIQDRVFVGGEYIDKGYSDRRQSSFVVAVNCLEAGDLCFCDSMGTGPKVEIGFDICLTEFDDTFLVQAGSSEGEKIVELLPLSPASDNERDGLRSGLAQCRKQMGRELNTNDLGGILFAALDHEQWDRVGERCLACGNCTMVCPTCFCYSVDEVADLGGDSNDRELSWDSCFSQQHSQISGATFQPAVKDRYRQWLTHKLASWQSQFGTSGCVGCGRCIAWCPVGIDLTEEVAAIRADSTDSVKLPDYHPATTTKSQEIFVTTKVAVTGVAVETADVVTLGLKSPVGYQYLPGQFNMLSVPGVGEVPISISGDCDGVIAHTIRNVGKVSTALCRLQSGDKVCIRGPYGSAWPITETDARPVTLVAGGLGLAPLRGVMRHLVGLNSRNEETQWTRLIYGARQAEMLMYADELKRWQGNPAVRVAVTVDRRTPEWSGNVGTVTTLLRRKEMPVNGLYFLCGPEVMMSSVVRLLKEAQIPSQNIYLSMERNMKCAAGHCGRCQYGPYFICKDGPVFSYDKIEFLFGKEGF